MTHSPQSPQSPQSPPPLPTPSPAADGRLAALRERLGWSAFDHAIAPSANRLPYMLGGLTFVGLIVLIVTGLILDQFFNPTPVAAHDSVIFIMTRVRLGMWIRALHYWAATVVFVSVFLHVLWVFWRRSYTPPREVTWWSGLTLLLVIFGLIFTGTVLRGDQEAVEAMAHAVAGAKIAGPAGSLLSPEFAASTTLFTRLHNIHVSLLPLALVGLIGVHFTLIRVQGIHAHEPKTARFTQHLRKLTGVGLILFAALGLLAAILPPGIGQAGVEGVEVTKPFWPFLWIYTMENTLGAIGMLVAPLVLFGFLALVPLLDRGSKVHGPGERSARPLWLTILAIAMLALYVGGIIYGIFAPQVQHLDM